MNDEIVINQEDLDAPVPKKRRRWGWRRVVKTIFTLIFLAIVGAVSFLAFNALKVTTNPFSFGALKGEKEGRINIMMLGVGDPGHDGAQLSDTNIILSVDTRNKQIALIGIPRDLQVRVSGYGLSKINNAHAQGGVKAATQVYEDSFGVPIHYYVKANFTGLKEVVDAVGGVDVYNPNNLYDPEYPCDKNQYRSCGFRLKAGHHHLDGATALKYVRCRKGTCGDDFGRAERQQQVMQSIRQKATSAGTLTNPAALGKLVSAVGNNIETDLSVNNMMRLNDLTKDIDQSKIYNIVFSLEPDGFLESSYNSSDLVPASGNFNEIQGFIQSIFKYGPIWTEHPHIVIQNGTAAVGLGGTFQRKLRDEGHYITVDAVTNAPTSDHAATQIIDYTGGKRPHTVKYLQELLKVQQVSPPPANVRTPPADIVVILGTDYANSLTQNAQSGETSGSSTDSLR